MAPNGRPARLRVSIRGRHRSMSDAYTAAQAARVIGRSERLVRVMAADGRLDVVGTDPLRVSQESVHRERNKRRSASPAASPAASPPAAADAEQLQAAITAAVSSTITATLAAAIEQLLPRMLETRDAVEQRLADELARSRAETEQLRQETERLRAALRQERARPRLPRWLG